MCKTVAGKYFENFDHDPYVRLASRLFQIPIDKVDHLTRFKTKINLFFIDLEGVRLEVNAKCLWEHYINYILPNLEISSDFRDEDHFYEHYLFMTEDVFYEYPGWYDIIGEKYDEVKQM